MHEPASQAAISSCDILERFESEWQAGIPPSISQFLGLLNECVTPDERRTLLHEMLAVDLWHRWTRLSPDNAIGADELGSRPRLDDYARRYAELVPLAELPATVIREEYRVRRMHGERITPSQYQERFGGRDDVLNEIVELELELASENKGEPAAAGSDELFRPTRKQPTIRCPNCQSELTTVANALETMLHCSSCGGSIRLVGECADAPPFSTGGTIGHFQLLEPLGKGSFGTVWRARDTKLERDVAIKIPRYGQLEATEVALFLREARSAAQLRHPNIVAVHEVGLVDDVPYIVSDLVRGVPLSEHLKQKRSTPREAAALCAKIADALHHAHEAGVVHRDLKPSNLLLDAAGEPHLTDFGLARRTGAEATLAADGQVLGTPSYMSPEQARGESHLADQRSDIYSLGVMLFQMLTGELPFRGTANMIMLQIIHDDPPSPRKLVSHLARDLETICLKCLEKPPSRRYSTAKELADDLRRYLRGEPIHARSVSRPERALRWAVRNPTIVALTALVALTLIAGTVASSVFALRARREAAAALDAKRTAETRASETEAMFDFVEKRIFAPAGPRGQDGGLGSNVTLRQALVASEPYLSVGFKDKPLIEARLRTTLGNTFADLGDAQSAVNHLRTARTLLMKQLGKEDPETLDSANDLATSYARLGLHDEASKLFEETLAIQKRKLGADHPITLATMNNRAEHFNLLGRYADAVPLLEETLAGQTKKLGADHPHTLKTMNNLARSYRELGLFPIALELFHKTVELNKAALGQEHPDTLTSMNNLAASFVDAGRKAEALELFEKVLEARKRVLGPQHPDTLASMHNLADTYYVLRQDTQAVEVCEQTLAVREAVLGREHPGTIRTMKLLARILATSHDAKIRNGKRAVELATTLCELTQHQDPNYLEILAAAYAETGNFELAVHWAQHALKLLAEHGDPELKLSITVALELYKANQAWPTEAELNAQQANEEQRTEGPQVSENSDEGVD